jgi:uncharacterized protein
VRVKIELNRIEDEPLRFEEQIELEADRLDDSLVAGVVSVRVSGTVRASAGRFLVAGSYRAAGPLLCARCLEPVEWRAEEEFSIELRLPGSHPVGDELELDGDELEVAFLHGDVLDVSDLAAEQVLLALPMRVVCDDACAGLCPRCGANRNIADACSCEPEVDPRWHALRDIAGRDTAN